MKYYSIAIASLTIIAAVACGTPSAPPVPTAIPAAPTQAPAPPSAGKTMNIDIKLFTYKPDMLQVPVGTTVVWTNQDGIEHSVTNGTPPNPAGAFDSGLFSQGKTFAFTFDKPGDYPYFCVRHNSLQGTLKVVAQ